MFKFFYFGLVSAFELKMRRKANEKKHTYCISSKRQAVQDADRK